MSYSCNVYFITTSKYTTTRQFFLYVNEYLIWYVIRWSLDKSASFGTGISRKFKFLSTVVAATTKKTNKYNNKRNTGLVELIHHVNIGVWYVKHCQYMNGSLFIFCFIVPWPVDASYVVFSVLVGPKAYYLL